MCTSFVCYSKKTYIGMNFDISERPIKLSMRGADQLIVTQKEGSRFLPAFGFNKSGSFMNMQMVDSNETGKYRRSKNCVHINRVFDDVLGRKTNPTELEAYLHDKVVVNVPNISVHSLIAGRERIAHVVEPGRTTLSFDGTSQDFLVLTNFPLVDFVDRDYREVTGSGAERYKTCYKLLSESQQDFNLEQGFSILGETTQTDGDFPTQLSTLAIPEEGLVYFVIKREFAKRYLFSFADDTIRTTESFVHQYQLVLGNKGVLISELVE